jgi:hypothetical protein
MRNIVLLSLANDKVGCDFVLSPTSWALPLHISTEPGRCYISVLCFRIVIYSLVLPPIKEFHREISRIEQANINIGTAIGKEIYKTFGTR